MVSSAGRRARRAGVRITALGAACALLTAACTASPEQAPATPEAAAECRPGPPSEILVPPCGAWWGMHVPYPDDGDAVGAVTAWEKRIGRKLDMVSYYHDMSLTPSGELLNDQERRLGRDRILLLAWETELWRDGGQRTWADLASGRLDKEIVDPQARRIKAYGKPVIISFDGEMEIRPAQTGTPEEYVAAFRHLHDRFAELGVDNVIWAWVVTGYLPLKDRWKAFYPGPEYVDWIGFDQYNYYPCRGDRWQSFTEVIKPTYDWFQANGFADKPIMLGEYGTEHDPDRPRAQGEWYADLADALRAMPAIKAVVQWNDKADCDFRLRGEGAVAAFGRAGADPYFRQPHR